MKKVLINQLSRLDELMRWLLNTVRVFLFIVFFIMDMIPPQKHELLNAKIHIELLFLISIFDGDTKIEIV